MALSDLIDIRVEFGLGSTEEPGGVWDTAKWDEDTWSGTEVEWTDVTQFVHSAVTKTGKQAYLRRSRTGTMTIILNNINGWFTPGAGETPPGYLELRPGRPARIIARPHGDIDWQPIWYGSIDTLENTHGEGDILATVRCTDAFGELSAMNTVAVAPEGAGERTDHRITRILDHHDWPIDRRDIVTGNFTVQATTLAGDALAELQLTTDSDSGDFWQKPDGRLAFRGRFWQPKTPSWYLGLAGIPVRHVETEWTRQRIVNEAHYARVGGTEQIVTDSASRALYRRRTYQRLDLINDQDGDVLQIAESVVKALKGDRLIIRSADVIVSDYESSVFVTDVSIGDMIEITVNTVHGWSATYRTNVISLSDQITAEGWVLTVGLNDITIINENGPYNRPEFSEAFHLGGEANAESA